MPRLSIYLLLSICLGGLTGCGSSTAPMLLSPEEAQSVIAEQDTLVDQAESQRE